VCKGYRLAVEEPGGLGRLRAAGVVGTIDTLKIMSKKYYGGRAAAPRLQQLQRQLGKTLRVGDWQEAPVGAPNSRRRVWGIGIVKRSAVVKELILTKRAGRALNAWSARQPLLKVNTARPYEGPADARAPERPPGGSIKAWELKQREISQGSCFATTRWSVVTLDPGKRQMNILLLVDTTIEDESPSHVRQE
jgi:hypothetical protein